MKTQALINKLQKLVNLHGDCEINIWNSFSKTNSKIDEDDIAYDEKDKDIFIGSYN